MMSDNPRGEMPFLEHLEELRWRILWSLLAVVVGSAVGIFAAMRFGVMDVLTEPLYSVVSDIAKENPEFVGILGAGRLGFMNLTEPFFFILRLGILVGLILASPIIVHQVWGFLAPALEDREKRLIVPSLGFGLLLFATGVALAYFVALPFTIRFLLLFGAEWFTPVLTAGFYLSLVTRLLLGFGVVFELPVVVVILTALGLVTPGFLRAKRRHAIVAITVVAAVLSPGDYISMTVLLMVPLVALYELSILLSVGVHRRREAALPPKMDPPPGALAVIGAMIIGRRLRGA